MSKLLRRLAGRRALARLALWFERLWPALWPPLGVAGLFVCFALLDLPRMLPALVHLALLVATIVAVLALAVRGLWAIRAPDDVAADRRLEVASGLAHRPLAVLADRPAQQDAAGHALWQAHVGRAIRQIRRLRVGLPRPGLARRDRYALRAALLLALIACVAIAGADAPSRLAFALQPTLPREQSTPETELQAWITPPGYTHLAPIFLKAQGGNIAAPAGSHLTISVTGGSGTPTLALDGRSMPFRALDKASFQADRDLTEGGHLAVRRSGSELAGWNLAVIADEPPRVAWANPPGATDSGQETRLPWKVSDDYGVVSLQAELRLQARPDAPPLVVSIPLPGGAPKAAHGVNQQDFTAHPWAGLPVVARLVGRDAPGQQGTSADVTFTLPERMFLNPLARALIAVRKSLSLHPEDRDSAVDALDALMVPPQGFKNDFAAYTNLSAIYYLLEENKAPTAVGEAQQRLWQLALHLEEGQTEQTARELEQARQAARDALDKAMREPTDANREALEKRLQELEQAIERHMQALIEEAQRKHEELPFDPEQQHLSNRDLERMAEAARDAAREGRMDDAQRQMAQLERMLDKLRNARAQTGKSAQQRQQQRQRGRQQMGALQDMIGRQGGLLDHSQGRNDDATRPRFGDQPTQSADPNAQREADRRVQQALRRALGELMQQFSDLSGKLPQGLGQADTAMRDATKQLAQGDDAAAAAAEQKAIEALQKGGSQMSQAMAQQFGPGQSGEGEEEGAEGQLTMQDGRGDQSSNGTLSGRPNRADGRRDPLGRRYGEGTSGADEGDDVMVPEQREHQRTRAIEEELRRRDAQRERPQEELDYIDRLLKRF